MNREQTNRNQPGRDASGPDKPGPFRRLGDAVDKFLWKRGFSRGPVRRVAKAAILLSAFLLVLGLILLPLVSWPFWLGFGAVLSAWNFYSMARYLLQNFPLIGEQGQNSAQLIGGQLGRWILRLFITVFLVYMALVHFGANPFALLAGLGLTVLCVPVLLLGAQSN